MKNKNFCAFILSHGRANNLITARSLKKCGYNGRIIILIDDEDKTADQYYNNFDEVVMFSKKEISKKIDRFDNFNEKRSDVYVRNACFDIAKKLNIKYFIQLDDDYKDFEYRYVLKDKLKYKQVHNLDHVFDSLIDFMSKTTVTSIALSQGGDFIGGSQNKFAKDGGLKRKAMNSFICSTDRPFKFYGTLNDDVNTYLTLGSKGKLFFTTHLASINQKDTQTNAGGMTDIYLKTGTYIKSFYSLMCSPSSVKIRSLNGNNKRLHHSIAWRNAVPVILDPKFKR
tara:strand:- start:190 stop:1038 length:849 start_codon:yes stop_codon:yes gene_type:complete